MGNKIGITIMFCMLMGLFCCKSRPADVITPTGPTDSPTHQSTVSFLMFDSTWRNDTTGQEIDYGINRITIVLIDSVKKYVVYDADTYTLKAGETSVYEAFNHLPHLSSTVTLYPDTIRFFGTGPTGWNSSQTDHVVGYKVK